MIKFMKTPFTNEEIEKTLDADVLEWFKMKYKDFSPPQKFSIKLITQNKNVLISSPTGTGKTLSAFLSIINNLVVKAKKGKLENKVYAIYLSPLRALGNDIKVNLDEPFREITELIASKNHKMQEIRHAVRTGDTTPYQKQRMNVKVPHILITTPESLALVLCAPKFVEKLKNIDCVIIDEIHALCENKRGTHLSLSLERLQNINEKEFTRIGLSATIAPIKEIAHYLIGDDKRACKVIDISYTKERELRTMAPVENSLESSAFEVSKALYNILSKVIEEHETTLIFTNTRSGTESVVLHLQKLFTSKGWEHASEKIVTHHSSLSKEKRLAVEEALKNGKAKVVVSSTSLELGIDIGSVDTVIQIGSPKSIARCLQRVGRAGHRLGAKTVGYFVCPDTDDLLEVSVMLKKSYENKVDRVIIPKNCLDVLAQHLMGLSLEKKQNIDEAFKLVKGAYPYKDLTKESFMSVLKFLSGSDESLNNARVYGKIWLDDENNMFGKRGKLAKLIYMSNIGTIPDETKISVVTPDKQKIGFVEESFLEKLRKNDIFVLGGSSYQYMSSSGTRMKVLPVYNVQPTVPSWFSEQLPLSFDLAADIRVQRAKILNSFRTKKTRKEIIDTIEEMPLDEKASSILYQYFKQQHDYMKKLLGNFSFTPNTWLVEHYNDPKEGFKIIFHTLYGRRVNEALSRIYAYVIGKELGENIALSVGDNGFIAYLPKAMEFDHTKLKGIDPLEVLKKALENTELLKRRFRHVAVRGLMILKRYKGYQMVVGRQQMTSSNLLKIVSKEESFPILEETYREIMEDCLDLNSLNGVLEDLNSGKIEVLKIGVDVPTPFCHSLLISGKMDVVQTEDRKSILRKLSYKVQAKIDNKKS